MDSTELPAELFVISDLHVGGKYSTTAGDRGFRINTHIDVLARFIGEVGARARTTGVRTQLVINGDFVDFLAEEVPADGRRHAFIGNQEDAVATFDAIATRDLALFEMLRDLRTDGVAVTIVLGNHDVELSLPAVRSRLALRLGAEEGRGFKFVYDGEAYVVGDVLIEHGNRYDGWNVVDFDRLRRFRSECSRRLDTSADARFFPPAGAELVERIMNPIKKDYPFIDLLKPETDAAIPLLLALEPDFASVANAIETARLQRKAASREPVAPVRPAQPGNIAGGAHREADMRSLRTVLAHRLGGDEQAELMMLIDNAQRQALERRGEIAAGAASRALSFLRLKTSASRESRLKILLGTLRALQDDKSFDPSIETGKEYLAAAEALAARGFARIVFGHTHLAKDVTLAGGARYLNTGTWADLMRVPDDIVRGSPAAASRSLTRFVDAISDRRFGDYLVFRPTFAHIRLDGRGHAVASSVREYEAGTVETL